MTNNYNTYTLGIGMKICCDNKAKKLIALKKANSLISKIISMVEEDKYCVDIMQQNLAVMGLLRSFHQLTLEQHLQTCFKKGMEVNSEKRKKDLVNELLQVTNLVK